MDDGAIKPSSSGEGSASRPPESKKERRRRERRAALASQASKDASGPSGASTPALAQDGLSKNGVKDRGFDPDVDFIAFDFDSVEDLSGGDPKSAASSSRTKEKGKEKEREARTEDRKDKKRDRKRRRSRSQDGHRERESKRTHTDESEPERRNRRERRKDKHDRRTSDEERDRFDMRDPDRPRIRDRDDRDDEKSSKRRSEKEAGSSSSSKGKEKEKPKEREWDRGKKTQRDEDDSYSRKYPMVFDPEDGYSSKKQRTDARSRKCPWASDIDWDNCHHVAEMLHKEVEAFTKWIAPTPVEDEVRGLIVEQIRRAVVQAFPDASVLPFGSYETKLYLPLGDIDLVIMSKSMEYSDKVRVLHVLAGTLRKAGITYKVSVIAKAKVPIIKFVTTHGRFNVDISINQSNGIVSGQIINGFINNMHNYDKDNKGENLALRSLVMVTKAFLSQRGMNEVFSGGLGSYSIVCLAVSFLQMHPKIRRGELDPNKNLGVLLMEFFELYGVYFNYEQVGISLRDGGMYFNKKKRAWHSYDKPDLLSIEDPADPMNDISRGSYGFSKVRVTFAGAFNILTSTAFLRAGALSAKRDGRYVSLRQREDPEDMSILSSVMGVTQETVNHRKLVQELYDKRTLHKMLGLKPRPEVVAANGAPSSPMSMSPASSQVDIHAIHEETNDSHDAHKRRHPPDAEEVPSDGEVEEVDQPEESDEDEGGRYNIGRQPPKKRQKTGKRADVHTVFTTDDDEDEDELIDSEAEEAHYASPSDSEDDGKPQLSRKLSSDQRRSYWASKGIPVAGRPVTASYHAYNKSLVDIFNPVKMASRNEPPPVNLKERIAALQQRNASSSGPASPAASATVPNSAGLRDKIARFEKKGGVPVPRGSFGLGAPPPPENAPEKRRGELYGNRIPSAPKVGSQPGSRSASPFEPTSINRSFSMSVTEGEDSGLLNATNGSPTSTSPPVSPFLGSTVDHKAGQKPVPRGTAWGAAVELAKQAELEGKILPSTRSTSTSPPAAQTPDPLAAPAPVSIVVSDEPLKTNGLDVPTILNSPNTPLMESPTAGSPPPTQPAHSTGTAAVVRGSKNSEATKPTPPPTIPEVNIQPPADVPTTKQNGTTGAKGTTEALGVPNGTTTSSDDLSPLASPIGPFSLANAVSDLGKVVANIQDMFPGQISPINSPLPYRSFRAPEAPQTAAPVQAPASKQPAAAALAEVPQTAAPAVRKTTVTSSRIVSNTRNAPRPNTMFETSPTQGAQVSRATGQPHPSTLGAKNYEHFPPTPNPAVDEFGAVPSHQKKRSISESSQKPTTFTAKVYKKVTELPSVPAASTTSSFYTAAAKSSSAKPAEESTALPEISLLSPGFGELSSLLQDAALLEFTLEQGDIPTDTPKTEVNEEPKQKKEEVKPKEVEKKAEEAERNQTPVPPPPGLEQRSSQDGRKTPTRARSLTGPRAKQPSIISEAPPTRELPERTSTMDSSSAASQTSPKSNKGYFSSTLRRLASSSKTSVNTLGNSSGQPRYSASVASVASTEDGVSARAPPSIDVSIASSSEALHLKEGSKSPTINGLSPSSSSTTSKKSPMSRAASFAGSMFGRGRKAASETSSASDPYAAIQDRLTKKTNKSALIPPVEASNKLEVPGLDLPSPQDPLVSPRRHSSLYVPSTSFEPNFNTRPVSSVWGTLPSPQGQQTHAAAPSQPVNLDAALFSAKPTSPIYSAAAGKKFEDPEPRMSIDAAFAADITSSVYIPPSPHVPQSHLQSQSRSKPPSTRTSGTAASSRSFLPLSPNSPGEGSEGDIEDANSPSGFSDISHLPSPDRDPSILPSPNRPPSLLPSPNRPPSYMSDEPGSGLTTPLADSFPQVPATAPLSGPPPPAGPPKAPLPNLPQTPGSALPPLPASAVPYSAAPYSAATASGRPPRPLPSLPIRSTSFFDAAPSLSSAVGSEFMPSATLPQRSATVREQRR